MTPESDRTRPAKCLYHLQYLRCIWSEPPGCSATALPGHRAKIGVLRERRGPLVLARWGDGISSGKGRPFRVNTKSCPGRKQQRWPVCVHSHHGWPCGVALRTEVVKQPREMERPVSPHTAARGWVLSSISS